MSTKRTQKEIDEENAQHVFAAIVNAYDNGFAVLDMDDEQLAIDLNRYDAKCGWFTHNYLLHLLQIVRPQLADEGYKANPGSDGFC
jgi:hypothetical protein